MNGPCIVSASSKIEKLSHDIIHLMYIFRGLWGVVIRSQLYKAHNWLYSLN